jgi:hypothetical protein
MRLMATDSRLAFWIRVLVSLLAMGPIGALAQESDCRRGTGEFAWHCAGPLPEMSECLQILERSDPDTWEDNYFCSKKPLGMKWSAHGPIPGMRCTWILETAEPAAHGWRDNFLCLPQEAPVHFRWSMAGPLPGVECVQWLEPADRHTWRDNYLCVSRSERDFPPPPDGDCRRGTDDFAWYCGGPLPWMKECVQITEPADPHTWEDNYFCSKEPIGMKWSSNGPVPGMRCTRILETAEPAAHSWRNNYLCVPESSPVHFRWSMGGPLRGMDCVQWFEPADPHTWRDNYLCRERERTRGGRSKPQKPESTPVH